MFLCFDLVVLFIGDLRKYDRVTGNGGRRKDICLQFNYEKN